MTSLALDHINEIKKNVARFGCTPNYRPMVRYMWNPVPTRFNTSQDIRGEPVFIGMPPSVFGIFQHTGRYGNYANQRRCEMGRADKMDKKAEITGSLNKSVYP